MTKFRQVSNKISELVISRPKTKASIKWINIADAGQKEIDYLRDNYNFDINHLKASISTVFSQRPMVSQEPGYLFMILHFPILLRGKIVAGEIEFFIGHGYLITIHNGNIPTINNFFETCKSDSKSLLSYSLESSIILLYDLLNKLIQECYLLIDQNSVVINQMEDLIYSQKQKEAVGVILNLRRNIINLRKILQNHGYILKSLTEVKSSLVPQAEIKKHYKKLIDHSQKIWSMLENQEDLVNVLNNTNESLLNDKMTNIMKTLTIFSVIVFPLTLFAAIFGMNFPNMPFVNHPLGFWVILCLMAFFSLMMLFFFEKKKWL